MHNITSTITIFRFQLHSSQCFDAVGSVTGRAYGMQKVPTHFPKLFGSSLNSITLDNGLVKQQVWKVLWTRKATACLLTLLYAYGKPRLCINIHHYAPPRTVLQQPGRSAVLRAAAGRCNVSEGSMSSFKSIRWNELWSQKWQRYVTWKSETVDLWGRKP